MTSRSIANASPAAPGAGALIEISMVTIGRWNDGSTVDDEGLFWRNLTFMNQIGLAN